MMAANEGVQAKSSKLGCLLQEKCILIGFDQY